MLLFEEHCHLIYFHFEEGCGKSQNFQGQNDRGTPTSYREDERGRRGKAFTKSKIDKNLPSEQRQPYVQKHQQGGE